ncbi:hypothetical protein DM02DRAFT_620696, partial [Periconia macrospinosa]
MPRLWRTVRVPAMPPLGCAFAEHRARSCSRNRTPANPSSIGTCFIVCTGKRAIFRFYPWSSKYHGALHATMARSRDRRAVGWSGVKLA